LEQPILELEGQTIKLKGETSAKDYLTLDHVLTLLMIYVNVLQSFAATSGNTQAVCHVNSTSLNYICHLVCLSTKYSWSGVLLYHMAFHYHHRWEMVRGHYDGWADIEWELMNEHLLGQC